MNFKTGRISETFILAPDGSEIRLLQQLGGGGLSECTLRVNQVSQAVRHRTVEEIWFVTQGRGQVWLEEDSVQTVVSMSKGSSITIPLGTAFQFRNTGHEELKIIISTMPPWPGDKEALTVDGKWQAGTVPREK